MGRKVARCARERNMKLLSGRLWCPIAGETVACVVLRGGAGRVGFGTAYAGIAVTDVGVAKQSAVEQGTPIERWHGGL